MQRTPRHFLAIPDFSREELEQLLSLAEEMRMGAYTAKPLAGKSLAMIFMKASTRTRVSFEVGTWQLGGHALFLSPRDVQLGRGTRPTHPAHSRPQLAALPTARARRILPCPRLKFLSRCPRRRVSTSSSL